MYRLFAQDDDELGNAIRADGAFMMAEDLRLRFWFPAVHPLETPEFSIVAKAIRAVALTLYLDRFR